jgi:hypothetical protein
MNAAAQAETDHDSARAYSQAHATHSQIPWSLPWHGADWRRCRDVVGQVTESGAKLLARLDGRR